MLFKHGISLNDIKQMSEEEILEYYTIVSVIDEIQAEKIKE